VVRAADVDVRKGVGEVEQLVGNAKIWHGFPDKEWLLCLWVDRFAFAKDRVDETDAAFGVAD
jgi:hypothetical protein